jgi:hypothetical protein
MVGVPPAGAGPADDAGTAGSDDGGADSDDPTSVGSDEMVMSTAPTGTTVPGSTWILVTVPS